MMVGLIAKLLQVSVVCFCFKCDGADVGLAYSTVKRHMQLDPGQKRDGNDNFDDCDEDVDDNAAYLNRLDEDDDEEGELDYEDDPFYHEVRRHIFGLYSGR